MGDASGMANENNCFTNPQGHKIVCKCWYPRLRSKAPRALVFVCHGFGEHFGWYESLADAMTTRGLLVFSHDHVGHGRSGGPRANVSTFQTYVDDMLRHCDDMKQRYSGVPLFLFGHSMGGCISLMASLQRPGYFAGLVEEAPAVVAHPDSCQTWKVWCANIFGWLTPWMAFPIYLDTTLCSKDQEVVKAISDDPLNYQGGLKCGWGLAFLTALGSLQARLGEVAAPLLVLHGDDDRLCDIAGSRLLHEKASSDDKTFSVYPGAFHQLRNEPDGVGARATREIVSWIVDRAAER